MNTTEWFGIAGAVLIGMGLYGVLIQPMLLRKILAFNLLGSGVFLMFGVIARRGAAAGISGDPIPHAFVITGIVVAFSASALAVTLALKLNADTGESTFPEEEREEKPGSKEEPEA